MWNCFFVVCDERRTNDPGVAEREPHVCVYLGVCVGTAGGAPVSLYECFFFRPLHEARVASQLQ